MEEKKKINNKSNSRVSNDDTNKEKRKKLKPIQVRRSIKDIIISHNPYDYIYNYKGNDIDIFDINKHDKIVKDRTSEIEENSNIFIENEILDNNEMLLRKELNELINKDDLSEDMKNDIKALYIEVQEMYLILKNDIKNNIPSSDEIIKLYLADDQKDKSTNIIWKRFCFYKLLSDKLNDLHISTISSYRHTYLKTIYIWYKKNKKLLFNTDDNKEVFGGNNIVGEINEVDEKNESDEKNEVDEKNEDDEKNEGDEKNVDEKNEGGEKNVDEKNEGGEKNVDEKNVDEKNEGDEKNITNQNEIIKNKDPLNCHTKKEETEKEMKKDYAKKISHNFDETLQEEMNKIKKEHEIKENDINLLVYNEEPHDVLNKYTFPNDVFLLNNTKISDKNIKNVKEEQNVVSNDLNVLLLRNDKDEEDKYAKGICEHVSLDIFINNNDAFNINTNDAFNINTNDTDMGEFIYLINFMINDEITDIDSDTLFVL
ncbi:hypothetical protein PFAG_04682 [Plasmodium falciparum Santa Lucia]|uniref:Uncharacterized protein n=1 Tax=Plasmodium falciparum Santa Lucia TaxID=478859 RepID=W7FIR7_PLAFA|nr:hypothetical protein PFAG_04682 [Plasmodium falciparum Santa Lucia]